MLLVSNTRIFSFRYKQETKTISEMDDNWPSMVAKSVSHPTVDDLGLVPNTRCNLRVVLSPPFRRYPFDRGTFVPSSGRRLPVAFSSLPAGRTLQSCGAVAQQTLTSFLCASKAQSLLLQHHHRDSLHRPSYPSPFRQRYVFSFVAAAAAAFAGFSSFRVVFCRWFAIRVKRFSTGS